MKEFDSILFRIKQKIQQIKSQNEHLTTENEELINQVIQLKNEIEHAEKRIKELENKSINLQFTNSLQVEDKEKLKTNINHLLTEIDKGLELLKG